jgi:hypothetical protein
LHATHSTPCLNPFVQRWCGSRKFDRLMYDALWSLPSCSLQPVGCLCDTCIMRFAQSCSHHCCVKWVVLCTVLNACISCWAMWGWRCCAGPCVVCVVVLFSSVMCACVSILQCMNGPCAEWLVSHACFVHCLVMSCRPCTQSGPRAQALLAVCAWKHVCLSVLLQRHPGSKQGWGQRCAHAVLNGQGPISVLLQLWRACMFCMHRHAASGLKGCASNDVCWGAAREVQSAMQQWWCHC